MKNNTVCVSKKITLILFIIFILASFYYIFNSSQNKKITLNSKAVEKTIIESVILPQNQKTLSTIPSYKDLSDAYQIDKGISSQVDAFINKFQCGAVKSFEVRSSDVKTQVIRPECRRDSMCIHEQDGFNRENTKCVTKSFLNSNNPLESHIFFEHPTDDVYNYEVQSNQDIFYLRESSSYSISLQRGNYLLASKKIFGTLSCGISGQPPFTKTVSVDSNDRSYYIYGQILDLSDFKVDCKYDEPGSYTASSNFTATDYNGNKLEKNMTFSIIVK